MGSIVVPTWDLFIIIFGCLIVGYNIIIGRELTIKLIISSYMAVLASDGLIITGQKILDSQNRYLSQIPDIPVSSQELIFAKIICFLAFLVLLSAKGGFSANEKEGSQIITFIQLVGFSTLSAGLIITTLLAFISGGTFIDAFTYIQTSTNEFAAMLYEQSQITRLVVKYAAILFTLPAMALILANIASSNEE